MRGSTWQAAAGWLLASAAMAQTPGPWYAANPATSPSPRSRHAMSYDPVRGQVVLFGGNGTPPGAGFPPVYNDTWTWDGATWAQKAPSVSPSPRTNTAMAFDETHGVTVLFGGTSGLNEPDEILYFNDTWIWDGANWTEMNPAMVPPARSGAAMAYDSVHGELVMFGGTAGPGKEFNDTWAWDGTNWRNLAPINSPPAGDGQTMVFDAAHSQLMMFGGSGGSAATWFYDGSNWSSQQPAGSPSARTGQSMAFNAADGTVVMFGGELLTGSGDTVTETWTWNGASWTQQTPTVVPGSGYYSAMAPTPVAVPGAVVPGGVVLFSGSPQFQASTWLWGGSVPEDPLIGSIVSAAQYGGFSTVTAGGWIEIHGAALGPPSPRTWALTDFASGAAPTMLNGVRVTANGQPAFVEYTSNGQVNVQLPSSLGTGPVQIVLTNGPASPQSFPVTANATQPGLLASPLFRVGPYQYAVATLTDGTTFIAPPGSIPGVTSREAKPGETIIFYGIGFGPVAPSIPAGEIVTEANSLITPIQFTFGGLPAAVSYQGLAGNFVGLYEFYVTVPEVPDSDTVLLSFSGSQQTLYTAVKR